MLIEDFVYHKENAGKHVIFHGMDRPNHPYTKRIAPTGWWDKYPVQDFDYQFNSWGFRGPEYEEYIGKPVMTAVSGITVVEKKFGNFIFRPPIFKSYSILSGSFYILPPSEFVNVGKTVICELLTY